MHNYAEWDNGILFTFRKHDGKQARTVRPAVDIVFTRKKNRTCLPACFRKPKWFEPASRRVDGNPNHSDLLSVRSAKAKIVGIWLPMSRGRGINSNNYVIFVSEWIDTLNCYTYYLLFHLKPSVVKFFLTENGKKHPSLVKFHQKSMTFSDYNCIFATSWVSFSWAQFLV